jgi:G6PDH family F420-dependent oxidoreductase
MAADSGIGAVWISDHYHPWIDEQGHSPFVWSIIGGIAATTSLAVTTAVTCPSMRIHPAIVAHAAATSAVLLDGRFELGVGTGENLNEHVLGDRWPNAGERLAMLDEAIDVMRQLWSGEEVTHRGAHYTVENARLYTLPETPPPIVMSAFGPRALDLATRVADGFVTTSPDKELLDRYRAQGGRGLASAGLKVCWGPDKDECVQLAHRLWRTSGLPGELSQELRTPAHFEQASSIVPIESTAKSVVCGPDVGPFVDAVREYVDAGMDRVFISQMGPDQEGFFRFFREELLPALADIGVTPAGARTMAAAR